MTGKQLRNSILQWAIQGKLVPQDPHDEPASVLLERIRAEKARLVKEKKIKKDKNESIIYRSEDNSYYEKFADGTVRCIDDEIPFELPQDWEWVRFSSIAQISSNLVNSGEYPDFPHIAPDNIEKGTAKLFNVKTVSEDHVKSDNHHFYTGQIIYSKIRPLLRKAVIAPFDGLCSADMYPIETMLCREYLLIILLSDMFNSQVSEKIASRIKMPKINQDELSTILIPVPPLSVQERTILKLKDITPLLQLYSHDQKLLETLNIEIFTQLKNSVLQYAIQGRLVPQIESEGTAEELLEEIRAEKKRLVKEGKQRKLSIANESHIFKGEDNKYYENKNGNIMCIDDVIPFDLPPTWQWIRIGSILNIWSARRVHEKDWRSKGIPFYRAREIGKLSDTGIVDNDLFIDRVLYDKFSKGGVPQIGDLMMTAVGTLGKTYIIESDCPFYFKDGSVLCIGNLYNLNPLYLKLFFDSNAFKNQYISESDGTTVATLTMVRMNKYVIPIPPLKEQARIVTRYNDLTSIMSR